MEPSHATGAGRSGPGRAPRLRGHVTPPVGFCLFLGMSISGLPMERLVRPLLPYLAAIVVVLLFVAFVPETVLVVPRLLGFVE